MKASNSPPEKYFFQAYHREFKQLGPGRPALIPQVYVHFDPFTKKQVMDRKPLPFQRMDFLLLFPLGGRVVVEIDGIQHYSESNRPSPSKYAEMVREDRALALRGYEVYRFGAAELPDQEAAFILVRDFFGSLFSKHDLARR